MEARYLRAKIAKEPSRTIMTTASTSSPAAAPRNSARRVLAASMIGTTIEFFDFYIYATAAVIV